MKRHTASIAAPSADFVIGAEDFVLRSDAVAAGGGPNGLRIVKSRREAELFFERLISQVLHVRTASTLARNDGLDYE
jgi:hypothetical protein